MNITRSKTISIIAAMSALGMLTGCRTEENVERASVTPAPTTNTITEPTQTVATNETMESPSTTGMSTIASSESNTIPSDSATMPTGTIEVVSNSSATEPLSTGNDTAVESAPVTNNLSEKYIVKVITSAMAPGEFTLVLNGEEIGSFDSRAEQDITALVKPGKNVVVIRHLASKKITNMFSESKMTIGVQRDGKWSTVANQSIRKDQPKGEKTFRFFAK